MWSRLRSQDIIVVSCYSPNSKTSQHVRKHMDVLYVCMARGSISSVWATRLLIGTPKLPKASIPPRAASHPHVSQEDDILLSTQIKMLRLINLGVALLFVRRMETRILLFKHENGVGRNQKVHIPTIFNSRPLFWGHCPGKMTFRSCRVYDTTSLLCSVICLCRHGSHNRHVSNNKNKQVTLPDRNNKMDHLDSGFVGLERSLMVNAKTLDR